MGRAHEKVHMNIAKIRKNNVFAAPQEYACRAESEAKPFFRSEFQRDRDRILYSKSFRRLSGKTQVFLTRTHDHVRNRLTHSLEVNQIATTTAKMLGLDHELTEAVSLGHDIGHTPFGHVGERTLNLIMNNCIKILFPMRELVNGERGFKHNLQGVRIFSELHRIYPSLKGTNLTNYTLYGIAKHSSMGYKNCKNFKNDLCFRRDRVPCAHDGELSVDYYDKYKGVMSISGDNVYAWSFEADVVEYADEISQRHHDVEDAFLMQILTPDDLVDKIEACFGECMTAQQKSKLKDIRAEKDFFGPLVSQFIVNMYNVDLIRHTRHNFQKFAKTISVGSRRDFINNYQSVAPEEAKKVVSFSQAFKSADECFQSFLQNTILNSHRAQRMDGKGSYLIEKIFKAYFTNPRQLHDSTILAVFNLLHGQCETLGQVGKLKMGEYRKEIAVSANRADKAFEKTLMRAICDHIAGMTDNFVMDEYSRLYGDGAI